ncbi:hypothetical protein OG339_47875 (plasmid) [Streptosporangium sp. NBC_01495]|uniref:hypothetical protein n=1 Tax=Streptosporangium sp. NBC_01495 TaxID=2903899 RepID=UPI002E30B51D|nr:hypothetical protein [Streptosporangium sp. NBC_01495]
MTDETGRWPNGFAPVVYHASVDVYDAHDVRRAHIAEREGTIREKVITWAARLVTVTPGASAELMADGCPIGWIERVRRTVPGSVRATYQAVVQEL